MEPIPQIEVDGNYTSVGPLNDVLMGIMDDVVLVKEANTASTANVKNKAGNGLKSKNSHKRTEIPASSTSIEEGGSPKRQKRENETDDEIERLKQLGDDDLVQLDYAPEVITVADNAAPLLVDLSETDPAEARTLYMNLSEMFPDLPKEYLVQRAEDLAGKPAAIDRLINALLAIGATPPSPSTSGLLSMPDSPHMIHNKESDDAKTHGEAIEPIPGPSGNALSPRIALAESDQLQVAPETEEEQREKKMNARWHSLMDLFPQRDPEFLHNQSNEFGLDAPGTSAFEAWVFQAVENGGKDLPSRESYNKRKKECID